VRHNAVCGRPLALARWQDCFVDPNELIATYPRVYHVASAVTSREVV